jgi:ubiquinone biosynthesis monooxygenase Coq7
MQGLPAADHRSRAILQAMRADELRHAENAAAAGAAELPAPIKAGMTLVSKIMTFSAYRI